MANNFTQNSDVKAVYRFESGARTVDSQGNGNTLSEANSPTSDTTNFQEGSASIHYDDASTQYSYIADANLSSGFPAKSSGGASSFTICFWVRPTDDNNVAYVVGKYDLTAGRSFAVILDDSAGSQTTVARAFSVNHGYNSGGSFENLCPFEESLTLNNWYWVHYSYNATTRTHRLRIWDDTNSQWLGGVSSVSDQASNDMSLVDSDLAIGCRSDGNSARAFDGNIDELVFIAGILSDSDAEDIRDQTYAPSVTFDSNFEGGNGTSFSESPSGTFNITTECDPSPADSSYGDNFYFKLSNVNGLAPIIKIDMSNDRGGGPSPGCNSNQLPWYSYDQTNWVQVSSTSYASDIMSFTVPNSGNCTSDAIYISLTIPYTYSDLVADVTSWGADEDVTVTDLGDSSGGRNMYHMEIGDGPNVLAITCRCHPTEAPASWMLKGAIDWLLSADANAQALLASSTVHVFPMVNTDGVYAGRMRCLNNGEDANRDYDESGPNATNEEDETYLIHTKLHAIQSTIDLFIDMHGSYEGPNIWRDPLEFDSDLETEIESLLASYDTSNYWDHTFDDHSNAGDSVNTTWRDGVHDQYGIDTITIEGGYFKEGGGELDEIAQQAAGAVLIRALLAALAAGGTDPIPMALNHYRRMRL